jgi:NAD(P)-dependent dehydrogenase (short-subunit alcohol dehydrogenase family)
MNNTNQLDHRVTVVTGTSRGLGRGIAAALAAKGARVVGIARSKGDLVSIAGDAADEALAARVVREERPYGIVLCAGAAPVLRAFHEQTWEELSTNWNVDTKSAFVWLKAVLRDPLPAGSHVIVVSSGAAVQGSPLSGGYAGAKRAQWMLADYAATEARRAGLDLRVNVLLPNLNPSTDLGRAGIAGYAARAGVPVEQFQQRFLPPVTPEIMGAAVVDLFTTTGRPRRARISCDRQGTRVADGEAEWMRWSSFASRRAAIAPRTRSSWRRTSTPCEG